jgi:flagellin
MALTVNTNVASLMVQANLNRASDAVSTTMTRLSSGLRINSAKDDAAGMQIASRLTSQIRGIGVAINNAGNAVSIVKTADGVMAKLTNQLQRMRDLTIQAKNAANGSKDRAALNSEFQQGLKELTRVSTSTKFGTGMNLLDGSAGIMTFQVGAGAGASERISLSLSDSFSSESLFVAPKSIAGIPEDATTTGSKTIVEGVYTPVAIDGTGSRNTSGDAALETALEGKKTVLDAASKALAATPGDAALETALASAQADYDLADNALKDDLLAKKPLIDKAISDNLDSTLNAIDAALEKINASRAELGAKQNRFLSTINNLTAMLQNTTAARGQIQDVDFAAESAELAKQQTLQQAATAVLAQANQLPAAVLKLLQ